MTKDEKIELVLNLFRQLQPGDGLTIIELMSELNMPRSSLRRFLADLINRKLVTSNYDSDESRELVYGPTTYLRTGEEPEAAPVNPDATPLTEITSYREIHRRVDPHNLCRLDRSPVKAAIRGLGQAGEFCSTDAQLYCFHAAQVTRNLSAVNAALKKMVESGELIITKMNNGARSPRFFKLATPPEKAALVISPEPVAEAQPDPVAEAAPVPAPEPVEAAPEADLADELDQIIRTAVKAATALLEDRLTDLDAKLLEAEGEAQLEYEARLKAEAERDAALEAKEDAEGQADRWKALYEHAQARLAKVQEAFA